jgi:hypothetical protein
MRKLKRLCLTVCILAAISTFGFGKQRQQESVTVTAVEVPVRVLQKGQVVRNLTREDFEIYENGVQQDITAFEIISRKISSQTLKPATPSIRRTFILIFNVFDYNDAVGEGIDYFFSKFFRPGDQILIITENITLNIEKGKNLIQLTQSLKETLKRYKVISTAQILKAYKDLDYEADRLLASLRSLRAGSLGSSQPQEVKRFYENYERIWKDYRRQFIVPDAGLYRSIARRLKNVEGEKWALCFQQREMFPRLRNEGPLEHEIRKVIETPSDDPTVTTLQQSIRSKQMELSRLFAVSSYIPSEELKAIFMEANISFHLILFRSSKTLVSQDFDLREVSQDYEDCFRQISLSTGGQTTFSNRIAEAVQDVSDAEDYHYLLVYSPKDTSSNEERKIEVKVRKNGYHVIHLKQFSGISTPPISLTNFKAKSGNLSFSMINYSQVRIEGKLTGYADVKVTIYDENSDVIFDEAKTLSLIKRETHIFLNIDRMKSGSHFVIIEAVDRITNEVDVFSIHIKI